MMKLVRNTAFTALALILTSAGLAWNKDLAASRQPLSSQQAVLAAQSTVEGNGAFPLSVTVQAPSLRLGQFQEIVIATVPDAKLDIVTVYPNGNSTNAQTLQTTADERGKASLRFKLGDFRDLGLFTVAVTATSGNKTAQGGSQFVLQTWAEPLPGAQVSEYVYPLVP